MSKVAIPSPVEDKDYFVINRVRYRLLVSSYVLVEEDEEFDDWLNVINPAGTQDRQGTIDDIMVVAKINIGSEERCISDPTKPFSREEWVQAKRDTRKRAELDHYRRKGAWQ